MLRDGYDLKVERHHVFMQPGHDHFLQVEPSFGSVARPFIENAGDSVQHLQIAPDTRVMK